MGAQGPPPEVMRLLEQLERIELERGAIVGLAAHLLGYLITLVLLLAVEDGYDPTWMVSETGQLLYNAMFVSIEQPVAGGSPEFDPSRNVLTDATLAEAFTLPPELYHAVPILALVLGGVVIARWIGVTSPVSGAVAGLSLGVGGLFFAITGTLLFSNDLGSPAFFQSVLLVGLVYPGVCGAVGGGVCGVVAGQFGEQNTGGTDHHR